MSKSISRAVKVYSLEEACERLAALSKHKNPRYSRGGFYKIVAKYKPDLLELFITEADLESLAEQIKKPGRPSEKVDKCKK